MAVAERGTIGPMSKPTPILLAGLLIATACSSESSKSPSPTRPGAGAPAEPAATAPTEPAATTPTGSAAASPAAPLSCDQRMDRFAAHLGPAVKQGSWRVIPPGIEPIESTRGEPLQAGGPEVVLARDGGVTLNGEPMDPSALDERLAAWLRMQEQIGADPRAMSALYIWVDRAADPATVARLAAAAPAKLPPRLVVVGPKPTPGAYQKELLGHPTVAAFRDRIAGADPSQRAVAVAEALSNAIGICAPLVRVFGDIASIEGSKKGEYMAEHAPAALRECSCRVADLDLVEYALLGTLGAFEQPIRTLPIADAADLLSR